MRWLSNHPWYPLLRPLLILLGIWLGGAIGFYIVTGGAYSLDRCAYMTAITLTTVGYEDVLGISQTGLGRAYTMVLLVVGMGATLYSVSSVTAFIVEGHLRRLFRERSMQKRIDNLENHFIVCGGGETGVHVVHELIAASVPFVLVDRDPEVCIAVNAQTGGAILTIAGDATHDKTLEQAGIARARGLVATLTDDRDNLFLVVTANYINPKLRVVAKCIDYGSMAKFKRAGATYVVSPTYIGGLRIASQLLRPNVVNFLDNMLRGRDKTIRVDEVEVPAGGRAAGQTLRDLRIGERTGVLVIAVRDPGTDFFDYNPGGNRQLHEGSLLVVIGRGSEAENLRHLMREG
jgi:voltage-gated potassium channel